MKITRGKHLLTILGIMGVIIVIASTIGNRKSDEKPATIESVMNSKLDSLFIVNGLPDVKLLEVNDVIYRKYIPRCNEEDELERLNIQLQIDSLNGKELNKKLHRIIELKTYIKSYHEDKNNEIAYYNRRIHFENNGKEFTCIQTIDTCLHASSLKHIIQIDKDVIKTISELE